MLERFVYTPYGERTILSASFVGEADAYAVIQGHQGGRFSEVTGLYHIGVRSIHHTLPLAGFQRPSKRPEQSEPAGPPG